VRVTGGEQSRAERGAEGGREGGERGKIGAALA
jgi:hypothetical protein